MTRVPLSELMPNRIPSLDPSSFPNERFTLWSIPSFDAGAPVPTYGRDIGSTKKLVQLNDVLLSKIVPHIRRSWIVRHVFHGRNIASSEWIVFRHPDFLPGYLRHFLISDHFHTLFMNTVTGVGGSLLRAQPKGVARIEIPRFPLDEQRRIVRLLDRADEIRRRADAARTKARAIIPALFLDMFGDPATMGDRFPTRLVDDIIAEKQLGLVRSTREQSVDGEFGYVRMNAITLDGRVTLNELRRTNASPAEFRTNELRSGDLLFNTRNSPELVGKMGIYRGLRGNLFNNNIMRIRLTEGLVPEYVNSYFLCPEGRASIEAIKKGTTSVCAVYYKDLKRIEVPIPPLQLQTTFAEQVVRIEAVAHALDAAAAKAEAMAGALSAEVFG